MNVVKTPVRCGQGVTFSLFFYALTHPSISSPFQTLLFFVTEEAAFQSKSLEELLKYIKFQLGNFTTSSFVKCLIAKIDLFY